MIKAVMFDMGGTLEDLYSDEKNDRATAYALYDILQKHHLEVPYEAEPLWAKVGAGIQAYKKASRPTRRIPSAPSWSSNRSRSGVTGASRTFPWTGKSWPRSARRSPICGRPPSTIVPFGSTPPRCSGASRRTWAFTWRWSATPGASSRCSPPWRSTACASISTRSPCPPSWATASPIPSDTLSRDVVGPRRMGFGRVFKINSFLTPQKDLGRYDVAPDYQITDIYDVYTILKQERDNA